MRLLTVLFATSVLISSTFATGSKAQAQAQACPPEITKQVFKLNKAYSTLGKSLKKYTSRQRSQETRIEDLPVKWAAIVAEAPMPPNLAIAGFGDDGKLAVDCSVPEDAQAQVDDAETALRDKIAEVVAYNEALKARQETLEAAEAGASDEAGSQSAEDEDGAQTEGDAAAAEGEEGQTPPESSGDEQLEGQPEIAEGDEQPEGQPEVAEGDEQEAPPPPPTAGADEELEPVPETSREPLRVTDNTAVFQRVLALPGNKVVAQPGSSDGSQTLPSFSVLYVFDRQTYGGEDWVEVGQTLRGPAVGWLAPDNAMDWNSMLVMQFKEPGQRNRVLFFKNDRDLQDLVRSPIFVQSAGEMYDKLGQGEVDERFVAIEPETSVSYSDRPYLLPILDWRQDFFDDGSEVTLVQVASVTSAETRALGVVDNESFETPEQGDAENLRGFRLGIVFVMDTTVSMGPYIDRTFQTIKSFYSALATAPEAVDVSYGLIGFRDNIDHDSALEYVTRVYQPLDIEADPRQVMANLASVRAATAPTKGWNEDSFAGLTVAMDEMDWAGFDARLIILITDAGARTGSDPLAAIQGADAAGIRAAARARGIAIVPIHLVTDEGRNAGNVAIAESQYLELDETGDASVPNYTPLNANDDSRFTQEVQLMADKVLSIAVDAAKGQKAEVAPKPDEDLEPVPNQGDSPVGTLANVVASEIFSAQLQYLGRTTNTQAPSFVAGWAVDRDLEQPTVATMEVSVFLSRNQLSALMESLTLITNSYKAAEKSPDQFFDELQFLAAQTATDPDLVRQDESAAIRELLPSYLQELPYKSAVLKLNRQYWGSLSVAQRQQLIEELESKILTYRNLYDQTDNWVDFGADDPLLEAYPMPLNRLP